MNKACLYERPKIMIKRTLIIILLLTYPKVVLAGFFDALGACFTDPCNCGDSNSTRWEDWNNQHINKGKKNRNCPPWNKTGGRNDHTCIVKAELPDAFIGYYENLCGEIAPESTYLNPQIRVRGQQCNAFACWTTSHTLSWDGECVTLASGWGLPLHRMCARIALPADYKENWPQDPGYTPKKHLNFEGAEVDDDIVIGYDGQPVDFNPPKLCLYKDPAFFSFSDGFDILDIDPNKQPAHKTADIHPVVKVIIFFINIASDAGQTPVQLLQSLFGLMNNGDDGETTFFSVLSDLFGYLGWIINKLGSVIIGTLKAIGQINRVVDSASYGCVNLPMGPYPPPFCQTIEPFFQTAYTQKICRRDGTGAPLKSTSDGPCVVSSLVNNLVRNSVRITFENFVPLCKAGQLPNTDKCVTIDNLGAIGSASHLHQITGMTDIVPKCSSTSGSGTCINTVIPHSCSVSGGACQGGFRVVYGVRIGSISTPQSYFYDDIPDCPNNGSVRCQEIWGINTSEFVDVSLTFPAHQTVPDLSPLQTTASLTDSGGRVSNFNVSIVRVSAFDPVLQFTQNPLQICVSQDDILVGCENRAPFVKPKVYDCSNPLAPLNCSSTYFIPRLVATITDGNDSTSAILEPKSVHNTSNVNDQVNLAGYNFGSFVTDDSLAKKAFSGPNAPNPGSIYGTYKNNEKPLNDDYSENQYAIYLYGLEYVNDKYIVGGKYACLENLDADKCPTNRQACVLSKLQNSNIVNCENFQSKLALYPGLVLCTTAQTLDHACNTVIDSLPSLSGGGNGINIHSCGGGVYCYTSSSNSEVCTMSNLSSDRYLPDPALGPTLSDSQYYYTDPATGEGYNFDKSLYFLRDKTSYEMNLCTAIPQPSCAEVRLTINNGMDNAYANWPAVTVGQISYGSCDGGLTFGTLQRRCVANAATRSFNFEPTYYWDHTVSPPVKVYDRMVCLNLFILLADPDYYQFLQQNFPEVFLGL